jgi:hypothetical protein
MEDFELYKTNYDFKSQMFSCQDIINEEVIIIRKEQLEEIMKLYCQEFGMCINHEKKT